MNPQAGPSQQPLSVPFADWHRALGNAAVLDVVVIGSGYGGSVAALRMREMGRAVVVLERGSEYLPGEFPNDIGQLLKYQRLKSGGRVLGRPSGLFEWRAGPGLASLTGNGLGGGSLINAGVVMRPVPEVFMQPQWPAGIRLPGTDGDSRNLDAAFDNAQRMLRAEPYRVLGAPPDGALPELPKTRALARFADKLARDVRTCEDRPHIQAVTATIDPLRCTGCGDCFTGCNVTGAKRTLRDTYLGAAYRQGAVLVTGALVWRIEPDRGGDWLLHCMATEKSGFRPTVADSIGEHGVQLRARHVVIAAGTFGSTELLQRSHHWAGERFPLSAGMLGTRLSANGDSIGASADEPERVGAVGWGCEPRPDDRVGPTITAAIDLRGRTSLAEQVVIQDGAVPGALARVYQEILATTWTLHHLGEPWESPRRVRKGTDPLAASPELAAHAQLLLAMGHDDSAGRMVWMPEMDACVPYWVAPEQAAGYRRQAEVFGVLKAVGGKYLPSPLWRNLPEATARVLGGQPLPPTAISVHPLGGCPMGDSFDTGVVDHIGRVWKSPYGVWPNLQVLDGSIVPTSLGCNPLWTITALAERAMAVLRASGGLTAPVPRPGAGALPQAPPRRPRALARPRAIPLEAQLRERLECAAMPLRGRLAREWGAARVEAELELRMATPDWLHTWAQSPHRFDQVSGRLRVRTPGGQQTVYEIQPGSRIDLLSWRGEPPGIDLLPTIATWWVLRGLRDLWGLVRRYVSRRLPVSLWQRWRARPQEMAGLLVPPLRALATAGQWVSGGMRYLLPMLRIWQAARERRSMRYDLRLARVPGGAAAGPVQLRVFVTKDVRYAATWREWLGYACHCIRRGWAHAGPVPRALRGSYAGQLTGPTVTVVPDGPHAHWQAWLPAFVTRARFELALPTAIQESPVVLQGGRDSSAALIELMAYPLLLLRHALKTRLLDFRLPDYSRRPIADPVAGKAVWLRAAAAGQTADVKPTLVWIDVPRGESSSSDGRELSQPLRLPIWRYARPQGEKLAFEDGRWHGHPVRRVKSVLLMHAFAMSGSTFTLQTLDCNLAEYLYAKGYEVWIADTRLSPRVASAGQPATLDQVGLIDAPAIVDHVLQELGHGPCGATTWPLQIFSFAHCMGAGAMLIGLLAGRLSYPVVHEGAHMPKLCALVTSQMHPFMVGARPTMSKTWVAPLMRNVARRLQVPLVVRGVPASPFEQLMDRLFASLPVPVSEACPGEGRLRRRHDDECATCRRIRFLDGALFKHRNLDPPTHAELPRLFGDGNVGLFAHGSRIVDHERLVDEDGLNAYATDTAIAARLGLAMRFAHGEDNELFHRESAERSSKQFARMQPDFAAQFAAVPGVAPADSTCIIAGHGHLDLLIGKDLAKKGSVSVFDRLSALFDAVWAQAGADLPLVSSPRTPPRVEVRFPYAGPWMGPVFQRGGQRLLPVAFIVDDMQANVEAPAGPLLACARLRGPSPRTFWLTVRRVMAAPIPATGTAAHLREPAAAIRVAYGNVDLTGRLGPQRIELLSCHETAQGAPPDTATIDAAVLRAIRQARADRARHDRPIPPTASRQQRFPVRPSYRWLKVPAATVAPPVPSAPVRIAVGCCRYPGFFFDRDRGAAAFGSLARLQDQPHLALMLGDQIYADATAGLLDPAGPVERYMRAHRKAFRNSRVHDLLARLPVVMTPDDHEFGDNHPGSAPLYRGHASTPTYAALRERALQRAARDALRAFQTMTWPSRMGGMPPARPAPRTRRTRCTTFELGAVRGIVIDTRSLRRAATATKPGRILTGRQRSAIEAWLRNSPPDALNLVCCGSVVLPGVVAGSDPANPGPPDSWQAAPADRQWLLDQLTSRVPGRFVLVSGDYHVSGGAVIRQGAKAIGATVIAPPFYAPLPYANEAPASLDLGTVPLPGLALQAPFGPHRGSGFGVLTLQQRFEGSTFAGWTVRYDVELLDMEEIGRHASMTRAWTL